MGNASVLTWSSCETNKSNANYMIQKNIRIRCESQVLLDLSVWRARLWQNMCQKPAVPDGTKRRWVCWKTQRALRGPFFCIRIKSWKMRIRASPREAFILGVTNPCDSSNRVCAYDVQVRFDVDSWPAARREASQIFVHIRAFTI